MAFVIRSPKKSPFQPPCSQSDNFCNKNVDKESSGVSTCGASKMVTQSTQSNPQTETEQRIHHEKDIEFRRLLQTKKKYLKNFSKNSYLSSHGHNKTCQFISSKYSQYHNELGLTTSPSIPSGEAAKNKYKSIRDDQNYKRRIYDFRSMSKYSSKFKQLFIDQNQIDIKANEKDKNQSKQTGKIGKQNYPAIQSSLSPKSMVKYPKISSQQKKEPNSEHFTLESKKNIIITPGPGSYNASQATYARTPIFHPDPLSPHNSFPCNTRINIKKATEIMQGNRMSQSQRQSQQGRQNQSMTKQKLNDSEYQIQKQEKLFPVKYNFMNSSNFKKSINLTHISNRNLLSKLFYNKAKQSRDVSQNNSGIAHLDRNKKNEQEQRQQYIDIVDSLPGPTTYTQLQHQQKNGVAFPRTKRFQQSMPQGSNKFYCKQNSPSEHGISQQNSVLGYNKIQGANSSSFASTVQRFKTAEPFPVSLQYEDHDKKLIRTSKNRANIGFNSKTLRDYTLQSVPGLENYKYYNYKCMEMDAMNNRYFMAKFDKYQAKRNVFQVGNEEKDRPSPGDYQVVKKMGIQKVYKVRTEKNSDSFKQNQRQPGTKQCVNQVNKNIQVCFYLCSQSQFNNKNFQDLPSEKFECKNVKKSKKYVKKCQRIAHCDQQKQNQPPKTNSGLNYLHNQNYKYYNTQPSWQTKSFNKNFSSQVLPSNNPIKNELL